MNYRSLTVVSWDVIIIYKFISYTTLAKSQYKVIFPQKQRAFKDTKIWVSIVKSEQDRRELTYLDCELMD